MMNQTDNHKVHAGLETIYIYIYRSSESVMQITKNNNNNIYRIKNEREA